MVSDYINVSIGFDSFKLKLQKPQLYCLPGPIAEGDAETESQVYALFWCRLEYAGLRHLIYSIFIIKKYCQSMALDVWDRIVCFYW